MEKMVSSNPFNPRFWSDKKVLITGHTGFKGSWLVIWLTQMGAHVLGYSLRPNTCRSMFQQVNLEACIESHFEDILNIDRLKSVFDKFKPDIVFHLAAQSLVHYSYKNPVETYQTNVMGTLNVLEAIRMCDSVKAAVMVTTDKCYENKEWVWGYRENDPMGGDDPYSSSKGCAELLIASYRKSFFSSDNHRPMTGIASARAGNVIGGGDWSENRLIPDCVRAIEAQTHIDIRNPKSIRPWQHVLDCLSGYLLLSEKLYHSPVQLSSAWNFGPSAKDMRSVSWVVDRFVEAWKQDKTWNLDLGCEYPAESESLKLDCAKAHSILGWNPIWTLSEAIEKTVEWYALVGQGDDPHQLSLKQIQEYIT